MGKKHSRAEVKRWRAKNKIRRKQVYEALKSRPCADCGVQYPPYVMQFDHLPQFEKVRDLTMFNTPGGVIREAAKCEVVCANCHAARTWRRLQVARVEVAVSQQPALFS